MSTSSERDVFIIHTRSDPRQFRLFQSLSAWCESVGLSAVSYDDWEWESTNSMPDLMGRMPTHPWDYMPQVNTDALQRWWRQCDVVVVVESGTEVDRSLGVIYELDELLRVQPTGLPPAIVVGTSLAREYSDKLQGFVRSFLPLSSPDDASAYPLVAVPWLVSQLQRSGRVGLEILDDAARMCPLMPRFTWFGASWQKLNLSGIAWRPPVRFWWPRAAELHAFMTKEGAGELGAAWRVLSGIIESRVRK